MNAVHPDDRAYALQQWQQAIADQVPVNAEFRLRWAGGGWRWTNVQAVAIRQPDGSIRKWLGINIDIEEKRQADQALHESEQRKSFLLKLSDALRPLAGPVAIQEAMSRVVLDHFQTNRCYYCEIDNNQAIIRRDVATEGLPSVAGVYALNSMPILKSVIDASVPVVVQDVNKTELVDESMRQLCVQLHIIAFVNIPVIKEGKPVGVLCIVQSTPRQWTKLESQLAEEVAERTWAAVERARAEEALRDKEERLRTLIQNLPDYAIFRLDAAGSITEWTNGAQQITGYSADEAIGQHVSLFYLPDAVAAGEVNDELAEAAQVGRTEREGPRLRKNGVLFYINEIATAIYDGEGQLTGFTKISRDITPRKAEQEQLRILEERTLIAVEAAGMGTWEWHLITDEVYWNEWNEQHFRLFGMAPQSQPLTPNTFTQQIHPDDQAYVLAELNRAIQERTTYDTEFRAQREDNGQLVWMSGYGRITAEVNGRPSRMNGVMFDITERRQATEALRESQQRLQIILDSIADHAIITFDSQTIIISWNGGAEQIFGYPAGEVIGKSIALIFTPEDRASGELAKEMKLARHHGQTPDERYHCRQDESRLYISGVLSPLYDANGQLLGYVKVARDLSERRRMEQALR